MKLPKRSLFKTEYKIVPTFSVDNAKNGYVPLQKSLIGWYPLRMYQFNKDGVMQEVNAFFKTYEEALMFVKYETAILTDEEILDAKNA